VSDGQPAGHPDGQPDGQQDGQPDAQPDAQRRAPADAPARGEQPVLPDRSPDDTDLGWGERDGTGERDDDWYERERPPHW